jgi:hypothetical protein
MDRRWSRPPPAPSTYIARIGEPPIDSVELSTHFSVEAELLRGHKRVLSVGDLNVSGAVSSTAGHFQLKCRADTQNLPSMYSSVTEPALFGIPLLVDGD